MRELLPQAARRLFFHRSIVLHILERNVVHLLYLSLCHFSLRNLLAVILYPGCLYIVKLDIMILRHLFGKRWNIFEEFAQIVFELRRLELDPLYLP